MNSKDAAVFRMEFVPPRPLEGWSDGKKADWARNRRFYSCNPLPGEKEVSHYSADDEKSIKPDKASLYDNSINRLHLDKDTVPDKNDARRIDDYMTRFNSLGAFGLNGAMTEEEFAEWQAGAQKCGGNIWYGIISFPAEQSKKIGYEDAEKLIKQTFKGFLREAKFDPKNVAALCAIHENTENKHLHICFYEKEPKYIDSDGNRVYRERGKIAKKTLNNYRDTITAYMDENKRNLSLYRDAVVRMLSGTPTDKDLLVALKTLDGKLPKRGRLQYNSKNLEPYRKDIDGVVSMFLKSNPTAKQYHLNALCEINRRAKELSEASGEKRSEYAARLTADYASRLGNAVLGMVKAYRLNPKAKVNEGRQGKKGRGAKAAATRARKRGGEVLKNLQKLLAGGVVQANFMKDLEKAEREIEREQQEQKEAL